MPYCNANLGKEQGVSLIELLCVISLSSILLGVGVIPVYHRWIQASHLKQKAHELFSILQLARTLAIQHAKPMTVCQSANGQTCGGTPQDGWIIQVESSSNHSKIIHFISGLYPNQSAYWYGARHVNTIKFQPIGSSLGYNGRLVLCAKNSSCAWFIFISPTGLVRLTSSTDLSYCL